MATWRPQERRPEQSADRPSLEAVLEHYDVTVKPRNIQMIWCPIHEEQGSSKSPSCSVRLDEGLWHCHGCGKGGDVWTLLMEKEGVNFEGARSLAAKLGFSADSAGRGSEQVSSGSYFRRRSVPAAKGRKPGDGGYKPSWRRK